MYAISINVCNSNNTFSLLFIRFLNLAIPTYFSYYSFSYKWIPFVDFITAIFIICLHISEKPIFKRLCILEDYIEELYGRTFEKCTHIGHKTKTWSRISNNVVSWKIQSIEKMQISYSLRRSKVHNKPMKFRTFVLKNRAL